METNLIASFTDMRHMTRAAWALREQGAIDIRMGAPAVAASGMYFPTVPYSLQVYVERSRCRLAEDTIVKFGGNLMSEATGTFPELQ